MNTILIVAVLFLAASVVVSTDTGQASADTTVGPLISSAWYGASPYDGLCPLGDGGRSQPGCVAIAMSQLLNYWQWPANGVSSHSYWWDGDASCGGSTPEQLLTADFSDGYDWDNVPDYCAYGCSSAELAAVTELIYETAVAMSTDFGRCESTAYGGPARRALANVFKYEDSMRLVQRIDYTQAEWFGIIQGEIDNGRPVLYWVNRHAIVCDGWRSVGETDQLHMIYGIGGSYNTWYTLDSLYCGWVPGGLCPWEEDFAIVGIAPKTTPELKLLHYSLDDSAGDGDGHADPGETIGLSISIINNGLEASGVAAQVLCDDTLILVVAPHTTFDDPISWSDVSDADSMVLFTIDSACPDPCVVDLDVVLTTAGDYSSIRKLYIHVGDSTGFRDDMESGTGYWQSYAGIPGYVNEWHMESLRAYSGVSSWRAGGEDTQPYSIMNDGCLVTPPFLLPQNAVLSFWHWMDTEPPLDSLAWDGGLVMISIGGGEWVQIEPLGGYSYTIFENPASSVSGAGCFSGNFDWTQMIFDLSAYSGIARIMFRMASDGWAGGEGWYIDDVEVVSGGCCAGSAGNVDGDAESIVDIGDLTALISYLYIPPNVAPICKLEANVDGDPEGVVDIGDLTALIAYLYIPPNPPPAACD